MRKFDIMKARLFLISVLLYAFSASCQTSTVSGMVNYKNYLNTPIVSNCVVNLMQGNTLIASAPVNNTGWFSLSGINPGTYTISAVCSGPVGGINSVDGLIVLLAFSQQPVLLTGLNLTAADVNGSGGFPNATDALTIIRWFVGQITSFSPPYVPSPGGSPWVSESFVLTVAPGQVLIQNIRVLCRGDVNGSHIP